MPAFEKNGPPVRLTASRVMNALGRVWRISELRDRALCGFAGVCLVAGLSTSAFGADQEAWTIRILPATKVVMAQSAPAPKAAGPRTSAPPTAHEPAVAKQPRATYDPEVPAKPPAAAPAKTPRAAGQPRIIPNRPMAGMRRPAYADVYHTIPFSRAEYEANPSYRNEDTMGILLGQMPTIIKQQSSPPQVPQYGYYTPYTNYDWYRNSGYNYNFYYPMPSIYTLY